MSRKFCILNCDTTESEEILNFSIEFPEFSCIGISDSYDQSVNLVLKTQPNIIFINIDRDSDNNKETPFNLVLELFQYMDNLPSLVAISSSKTKAYDVIKYGFFEYLLKPLSELDLRRCFLRFKKNLKEEIPDRICIKSYSDYQFIELEQILYLRADNNTTDFYLKDGGKIAAYKTLKFYESLLPENFMRAHNSYIINTNYLKRINFAKSQLTLFGENAKIPFSKSYKQDVEMLKKSLNSLNTVQA